MSTNARNLDIVIFGATGFTGKRCLPLIDKFSKRLQLTWGVAGRSERKLKEFLDQCGQEIGTSLANIPVIVADVQDQKTLNEMARKARIIINCCGPYSFFGEPVVKACVEEGTHHVDISGEAYYMEAMQLKYHSQAQEKGVYIISACGFDSIPADLGVVFLQKKFNGTLNSAITILDVWEEGEPTPGSTLNFGTWESAVYELGYAGKLRAVRRQLFPNKLPSYAPKLKAKTAPHKNDLVEGWVLPFMGSDQAVIQRSQRLFYEKDSKRPVQAETYFTVKSFMGVLTMSLMGMIFWIFAQFQCGRNLLLKYPEKFSFGFFSRVPPTDEKIEKVRFSTTLYGEGWKDMIPDRNNEYSTPPNKAIAAKVKGKHPGYGATCASLVLAAITVITETDKMPPSGGVYPPGYAFARTSLIEQLDQNEVHFQVLFEKDLS
ncbi:saccharopine dehydrogenase-like oxidoreductase isoform X1 [Tribolium castaneum]|uniref:saccharopine dehydrogenase-like oxidoreductase isoform X1 n=1 Tax=Tribolium castaneum TaxID=7070 RepID=UPI0001DCBF5D|nr:PREDICTED: saccharopine dehydrogenase-like oxidoreductase isoform X1 [Tribolium castaneum]|eukprot:XP_008200966.1 PREDICTED: saccharopine dehydrogenase-like oxidoreductase isoform X1 [Tribolium castaneum]